ATAEPGRTVGTPPRRWRFEEDDPARGPARTRRRRPAVPGSPPATAGFGRLGARTGRGFVRRPRVAVAPERDPGRPGPTAGRALRARLRPPPAPRGPEPPGPGRTANRRRTQTGRAGERAPTDSCPARGRRPRARH